MPDSMLHKRRRDDEDFILKSALERVSKDGTGANSPSCFETGLLSMGAERPYTDNPFCCANSFSEVCGRAPMCWITSAAASAPNRPAFS